MIAILGTRGMLGSMVSKVIDGTRFDRPQFDANDPQTKELAWFSYVINCIGLIKPYCKDVGAAVRVNAAFPYTLPKGTLHIATDCVYDGSKGDYVETDEHTALDVYGRTKSLGEAPHIHNLRCSIIGPENKNHLSLLEWFLAQETADGFTNHMWNGITTYHFAKICEGTIREGIKLPVLQHIVPADKVSKYELLNIINEAYDAGVKVHEAEAPEAVDRTLATLNPLLNLKLWQAAGYDEPPTVKQMVMELASL